MLKDKIKELENKIKLLEAKPIVEPKTEQIIIDDTLDKVMKIFSKIQKSIKYSEKLKNQEDELDIDFIMNETESLLLKWDD